MYVFYFRRNHGNIPKDVFVSRSTDGLAPRAFVFRTIQVWGGDSFLIDTSFGGGDRFSFIIERLKGKRFRRSYSLVIRVVYTDERVGGTSEYERAQVGGKLSNRGKETENDDVRTTRSRVDFRTVQWRTRRKYYVGRIFFWGGWT